jgi:biotin carboxylase
MTGPTVLCLASFEKGEEFLRECRRSGCRTILLTLEALAGAAWPRDVLDDLFLMPDLYRRQDVLNAVGYLARTERIARVVALDEFDVEMAAALREHLRIEGLGESHARLFRDKLAMRKRAHERGLLVPRFTSVANDEDVRSFAAAVPPPWVLKPRLSASTIGIRKLGSEAELWEALHSLGDERSFQVLERFLPGAVFHVDSVVHGGRVTFAEASAYAQPPLAIYHGGGLFLTRTLERGADEERALQEQNRSVVEAFEVRDGVLHTEFIRAEDGRFHFLETAARVGGAHIAEMLEAATGVNLWREWARLEAALALGQVYEPPEPRRGHAGLLITLARQERPDLSGYTEPEIVLKLDKRHHAGLVVAAPDAARVRDLLDGYATRFAADFHAVLPAATQALI